MVEVVEDVALAKPNCGCACAEVTPVVVVVGQVVLVAFCSDGLVVTSDEGGLPVRVEVIPRYRY